MDNQVQEVKLKNNDEHHQFPSRKDILKSSLNKFHPVDSRNISSRIREVEKRISSLNQARLRVADKLHERMLDRDFAHLVSSGWGGWRTRCRDRARALIDDMKNEIQNLQWNIQAHDSTNNKINDIASNEQSNDQVKNMRCRIKHGKCNLATERNILGKIKQADAEIAEIEKNTDEIITRPFKWNNEKPDEAVMKKRLKVVSCELEWLKLEKHRFEFNLTSAMDALDLNTAEIEIAKLQSKLEKIRRNQDEMSSYILELKSQLL